MPSSTVRPIRPRKITGLRYWMLQVIGECDRVSADFAADPVHDLRVALRRCRSLADGLMALDPDPGWKAMKKAGRRLFQRLGALRDVQVMMEWVEKLHPQVESLASRPQPKDPLIELKPVVSREVERPAIRSEVSYLSSPDSLLKNSAASGFREGPQFTPVLKPIGLDRASDTAAQALLKILCAREKEQQREAHSALQEFDRKQWRDWAKSLPARASRIRPGSALFKHLALERWTEARELHNRALRNRTQVAFHSLRIGIKRFRYIVENFLPAEHKAWKDGLKEIQDLLGEVHDLDVLWSTAISCHIFPDESSRQLWREIVVSQRARRIERYRAKMLGPESLWQTWRAGLPQGRQIEILATRRMKLWAASLDPDFPHAERIATLALQLYDGLLAWGWKPAIDAPSARSSLLAAALLHDVGKCEGGKGHHKASFDLIRSHAIPLGWKPEEVQRAAIVARFHAGALPTRRHKALRDLLPGEQTIAIQLAAILRLANAFDADHDGHIRRVHIEKDGMERRPNDPLIVAAEGYLPQAKSALMVAAERHLLETVLRRPVIVKAFKNPSLRG